MLQGLKDCLSSVEVSLKKLSNRNGDLNPELEQAALVLLDVKTRLDEYSGRHQRVLRDLAREQAARGQAEKELDERQKQLQATRQKALDVLESMIDGVMDIDADWRIAYINESAASNLGYRAADLVDKNVWEAFPAVRGTVYEAGYRAAMEQRRASHFETKGLLTPKWYNVRIYPSGEGITVDWEDITERKRMEEELRQSEERYRSLFNGMTEGFALHEMIYDQAGRPVDYRFLEVNPAFERLTGLKREAVVGHRLSEALPGEDPRWVEAYGEVALSGRPAHFENYSPVLKQHYEVFAYRPAPDQFAVLFLNITARKLAEAELHEINEKAHWLARMPDENPNPVLRVTQEGRVLFQNTATRLVGWDCRLGGLLPKPVRALVTEAVAQGDRLVEQVVVIKGRYFSVSVIPFLTEQYLNVYSRDITKRIQVEEELKKAKEEAEIRAGQLHRLNHTLLALGKSSQAMLHAEDETSYMQAVCRIVNKDCGFAMVWIGMAEQDEARSVRPVAYAGFEEGYLETLKITWADTERGRGPTGTAIRSGKPSLCRDMLTDPKFKPWREEALKRGYASSLVLPLLDDGKVFGAITIYSPQADGFAVAEIELLSELANDLAYGLKALRLRAAKAAAQEALLKSEERFRSSVESLLDGFAIFSAVRARGDNGRPGEIVDFRYEYINEKGCEYLGRSYDELINRTRKQAAPIFDNKKNFEREVRVVETGKPEEYEDAYYEKDDQGKKRLARVFEVRSYKLGDGLVNTRRDITGRKKLELELNAQAEQLNEQAKMLDLAHILVRDMQDRIIFWNSGAEKLYGWSKEEALGRNSDELFQTVFPVSRQALVRSLRRSGAWEGELVHTRRDGTQVPVASHQVVHRGKNRRPAAVIEVNNDITALKKLEDALQMASVELEERVKERTEELEVANEELSVEIEESSRVSRALAESEAMLRLAFQQEQAMRNQLIQSEKYAALARLVASVAHELNNPIQTIQNCMYLLKLGSGGDEGNAHIIEMAESESRRIAKLVAQLKETYRPARTLTREVIDVKKLLEEVQNILEPHLGQNRCKMKIFSPGERVRVLGVADQIKQVFLNISLNAIEAMQPEGGTLSIHIAILLAEGERRTSIVFKDTGPGIPAEHLARIFEPFFTTKPKGTGLGLSICYEIVHSHGGEILVESSPEKGAMFKVRLPLIEEGKAEGEGA
jgi:PAS domain S-box-containing protein